MRKIDYPVRCRIIDGVGMKWHDLTLCTPEISRPYIGKLGTARSEDGWDVIITLDDGTILHGYECWWALVEEDGCERAQWNQAKGSTPVEVDRASAGHPGSTEGAEAGQEAAREERGKEA